MLIYATTFVSIGVTLLLAYIGLIYVRQPDILTYYIKYSEQSRVLLCTAAFCWVVYLYVFHLSARLFNMISFLSASLLTLHIFLRFLIVSKFVIPNEMNMNVFIIIFFFFAVFNGIVRISVTIGHALATKIDQGLNGPIVLIRGIMEDMISNGTNGSKKSFSINPRNSYDHWQRAGTRATIIGATFTVAGFFYAVITAERNFVYKEKDLNQKNEILNQKKEILLHDREQLEYDREQLNHERDSLKYKKEKLAFRKAQYENQQEKKTF